MISIPQRNEQEEESSVTVSVDRRRVTSMTCSSHPSSKWCQHVVRLIFFRMECPNNVQYRLPVSDSVQRLSEWQLKQFVSLLLAHSPPEMLAFAQETLDDLRQKDGTNVVADRDNFSVLEVPDLTAGGGMDDECVWDVDGTELYGIVNAAFWRCKLCRSEAILNFDISAELWLNELQQLRMLNETHSSEPSKKVKRHFTVYMYVDLSNFSFPR